MATKSNRKRNPSKASTVKVKNGSEVIATIQNRLVYSLHDRYAFRFAKATQQKVVAYGPWLAIALVLVVLPQLLVLAKDSKLMSFSGFFDSILFNQQSWVILLVILANIMLLVDGIGDLFNRRARGWSRVYVATLISSGYVIWQVIDNIQQPAAAVLSLLVCLFILFSLFDIRKYYK